MTVSIIDRAACLNRWRNRALAEKVLIGLGFLALAVTLPPWPGAVLVAGVMVGFTLWGAGVDPRLYLQVAALPMGFLATGSLALLFQIGGGGIGLAPNGIALAAGLSARAMAAVTCLLFLALTTPAVDLMAGLRRIGLAPEIVEVATLTYRFVFLIGEAGAAMTVAQRARLGHSTRRRWLRSTALVIANLLPRAMDRARRMETGLAARGWRGEMPVLSQRRPASARTIAAILALQGAVCAVVWVM